MNTNLKDRVTIYEVAKSSGVSLATVSRVINKKSNVTEATRKKVEQTIARLGYKPSALAQALATNKTTNIGVVIPSANYVYISNMLNGLTEAARDKGFVLSLYVTSHNKEEATSMMNRLITSHVDGAIIFDDELDVEEAKIISSYQVPVVAVNNKIVSEKVASITFGYEHLLRNLLNDYFKNGDKKMYFLHVHNAGRLLDRIERSFINTHIEANRTYGILSCDDSYSKTYVEFLDFFKTTRSGYFLAYRDSIAAAVINAARDSGLRIPEDVEVLSLIGTKYASILRPMISNMSIDMALVGRKAMAMLIELMDGKLFDRHVKIESVFTKKETTR